jgi:16S rRNA (guanine966-N2)-methyltransferase
MLGAGGLRGTAFLDLYAGSGAVGLEALSRGARTVTLVDQAREAANVLARNIDQVALPGARVHRRAVEAWAGEQNAASPFDVAFVDPPYELPNDSLHVVLTSLLVNGWLAAAAVLVVERATRGDWEFPQGFDHLRDRRYGEATLWYGRAAG